MELPLSVQASPDLRIVGSSPSTNDELLRVAADPAVTSFTSLLTFDQTAGRGRLDRSWVAPPGTALALSVLIRGALGHPLASWLPLLAGLCMAESLDAFVPARVAIKWPNDVLLDARKVAGVLVEVAAGSEDVVVGCGLNLRQAADQLPVPTAMSLALAGVMVSTEDVDTIVAGYLLRLQAEWHQPGPASRLRDRISARCATIGSRVRVDLADGSVLTGMATGMDITGRLEVSVDGGDQFVVAAGDVTHARLG